MPEITRSTLIGGARSGDIERAIIRFLSRGKLSVFLFHKVPSVPDPFAPGELDLGSFRKTIQFIAENFEVIPLGDAISRLGRNAITSRVACITFDDGYADWMDGAVPVLEEYGLPATFFITSCQFDGTPMWHERISHAIRHCRAAELEMPGFGLPKLEIGDIPQKRKAITLIENYLKYQELDTRNALLIQLERSAGVDSAALPRLLTDQLRALHSRGFEIGAHTVNHPILSLCQPDDAMKEIGAVREVLSEIVRGDIHSFAYPNGRPRLDFGSDHIRMVKKAGYSHAVTTQWGAADNNTSVYQIPRFTPWGPTATHMGLQMARNLLMRPKLISLPNLRDPGIVGPSSNDTPLRILVVENGAGFGGAIIALQTLLSHYDPKKMGCHVVTNFAVGNFAEIPSVCSCKVISDRLKDFRPLAKRLKQARLGLLGPVVLFGIGRLDDLFNRAPYLIKLLYQAIKINPDIIHGNNEPNSNREAMLVAKFLGKPYVQHLRGPLGTSRHTPWLLAAPDAFIPVSRWMAGELLVAGVQSERVRQIYDAVDLSAIRTEGAKQSLRGQYGLSAETIIVAMIGMLVPWKGQQLFIDAVAEVRSTTGKNVKFLVVGGTPERSDKEFSQRLMGQVEQYGLTDAVIFTGQRNDIPVVLPEIDIVVSASIEPEPLGLVMLEAMASGCIFVGPAHGAATEIVSDGATGFLFVPNSSTSLKEKLLEAIACKSEIRHFDSGRARSTVHAQFSGRNCADKTSQLLSSLAN